MSTIPDRVELFASKANVSTMTSSDFSRQSLTTLPNVLTYLRMGVIPAIILFLNVPVTVTSLNTAFSLFLLASITDYLDGILARRHNLVTSVGKLLDPLADKLLTSAVLIMLIPLDKVQAWVVFLIIGREITVTGLRSIAASQGLILNASRIGKKKMVSQTVALCFFLLTVPGMEKLLEAVGNVFLWTSVVLGYWSALYYFLHFYREAKRHEHT